MLHPTEKYYPLRPELAESTFYLYQATKGLAFSVLVFSIPDFACRLVTFPKVYTTDMEVTLSKHVV